MSRARSGLQSDVDIMMLDYLVDKAIHALVTEQHIRDSKETSGLGNSGDRAIVLVDSMLQTCREQRVASQPLEDLEFRLSILRFVALFRRRGGIHQTTPSIQQLAELRRANRSRALTWRDEVGSATQNTSLSGADAPHVQLLDLLPMFVHITERRLRGVTSPRWKHLAAEFMLQAVLEIALASERTHVRQLRDEAFAWGSKTTEARTLVEITPFDGDTEDDDDHLTWDYIRAEYGKELELPEGMQRRQYLLNLQSQYPVSSFDTLVVKYMQTLAASLDPPVLTQLAMGDAGGLGLTLRETRQLLARCGVHE